MAPWAVTLAFFALVGPLILLSRQVVPDGPHAVMVLPLFMAFGVGTFALVWCFVAPRPKLSVFRWTAVPWIVGPSAWLLACFAVELDRLQGPEPFAALAGLTVLASALRQPDRGRGELDRIRDVVSRLSFGAGILLCCGPIGSLGAYFNGGWHPPLVIRAEHGAWSALETGPLSFAANLTVAVVLPMGVRLLSRSHPRARPAGTPLLAVAFASGGRAVVDLLTMIVAYLIHQHAQDGSAGGVNGELIETLAVVADLVGGSTLAPLPREPRSPRGGSRARSP